MNLSYAFSVLSTLTGLAGNREHGSLIPTVLVLPKALQLHRKKASALIALITIPGHEEWFIV